MISTKEYGYFAGRSKRHKRWNDLQRVAKKAFSETTILLFLIWFYEDLSEFLETPKAHIPGFFFK